MVQTPPAELTDHNLAEAFRRIDKNGDGPPPRRRSNSP
jgi:hypothetical protein